MKGTLKNIFNEFNENFEVIKETYKLLETTHKMKLSIHPAGQWILDNMYILEEENANLQIAEKFNKKKNLPAIKNYVGEKNVAIYYLACELVEKNTGYVDQNIILNTLKNHQKHSYLTSEELDLFCTMVKLALIKFIARICKNVQNSQIQKIKVEEILNKGKQSSQILAKLLNQDFTKFKYNMLDTGKIKNTNTAFVEYLAFRIKELGKEGTTYYKTLLDESEKTGFSVEEAIVKEHLEIAKTSSYIGRAILSFRQLNGINFREIYEKVNKIDETLMNDYTDEFRKCDYKTKERYRKSIINLSKKYKLSEVYIAKKVIECSIKYKKHVGFFTIGEDKYLLLKELNKPYKFEKIYNEHIKKIAPYTYVLPIIIIGVLIALLSISIVSYTNNAFINTLIILTAFNFGMELWEKFINYFLRKTIKPQILPRFDFAKSVDENNVTYVAMPTIISSIEKLDNMINKMEVTYLANRSENIYYMLIGDCISSDKKEIQLDKVILDYAKEKLDKLNKKYPSNRNLFNFMYRKRVYSNSERSYIGWERKRGALTQFNKLLLGKLSTKEINEAMTLIYDDIIEAKYVITIDEDTKLSLNTAKDLVAIIAHPLNKPILSKNKKIVEKGYGLIQPAVSLEIESANRSIFSKIFGGFGGLDIYTTAVSNVYQDSFEEAIFCGKGIYNVELFDKLLSNEIPEELVLSHDLLEGSYLRAGLASDIEVQDDFPNNFIAYSRRNHRWHRGDIQILGWLFSPKSPLNFLSKWKIFDNVRRGILPIFGCIALILSLFVSAKMFANTTLLVFFVINFGTIISLIDMLLFGKSIHAKEIQYIPLIHGVRALLLTMVFDFITLPYRAYVFLNASILSLYRMFISKRNLLQWTTADILDKKSKGTFSYYFKNMIISPIFGVTLLVILIFTTKNISLIRLIDLVIISFYIISPLFAYLLGKSHLFCRKQILDEEKDEEILDIAYRTWLFFDKMMTPVNNYLPTDNYQENRRYRIVNRTSSTNIGFAILSIINAYDLKFITKDDAILRLNNLYKTIDKLEKWNGHLLNWYNIKTLEPLRPRFVSTVDSGNFVASLYVAKTFFEKLLDIDISKLDYEQINNKKIVGDLLEKTEKYIQDTDFTKLYDTSRNLFSIGYAQEEGKLIDSYYDILMSESRITSLIAIASRQVTSKHWFSLSRSMSGVDGLKGLVSWTGTSFEYFMPYLFNKSYEHTLIDQSLYFSKYSQKKYSALRQIPWGISESAFAVRDSELNYQYQAFGIPWLGLKRGLEEFMVVSPYSSLLMIEYAPKEVYKNIKELKSIGAYSTFGFYEAIDYTKQHIGNDKKYEIVKAYMAHHQGMILTAINNYLNKGIIQKRFHSNANILACEILLKERERTRTNILNRKNRVGKEFKESYVEKYTPFIAKYENLATNKSEIKTDDNTYLSLLRNNNMSLICTSKGSMFLNYKNKIVNTQKYSNPENVGNFIIITDKYTGETFNVFDIYSSNLKKSCFISNLYSSEYYRETENLEVTTKVFLSQEYNAQITKVSIYNNTDIKKEMIINTYIEPALTDYMTNIVHPSFNNLQIETYYDEDLDILVASKRLKSEEDTNIYLYTKLLGIDLEKSIETEKKKLVDNSNKNAYDNDISKYPLWPILSYRTNIILDPHERQEFYYITGVEDNKYKISNAIVNLDINSMENQYKFTTELSNITSRYLELKPGIAKTYNNIINELLFSKNYIVDKSKYWNESLSQEMLWKFSISGDYPILVITIEKIDEALIVEEAINFMDYAKNRKITLDIIILINEEQKDYGPIYKYVKSRIDRASYMDYTSGNIYVLNTNTLTDKEIKLFNFIAKKHIHAIDEFFPENIDKSNIKNEDEEYDNIDDSINKEVD